MKNIITVAAILIAFSGHAQITVTSSDMPNTGNYLVVSMTGDLGTADPSVTGPNHTWNFSFLTPDSQKVDSFVSVSSTPFAYQLYFNNPFGYPNHYASYANPVHTPNFVPQFTVEDVYNFYKESAPEYSFVGFGAKINGVPASVKYDSIDVIYTFPVDYGNADSCWSKFGFSVPNYGYYGQEKHRVNTVDGWGTLTTPFGTFPVLRVRSVIDATDTVYNSSFGVGFSSPRPTEIEYKWLGQGGRIPLLQVNTRINTSSEVVTGVFYRDSLRNTSVAEADLEKVPFALYPNPANEAVNIVYSLSKAAKVSIEALDITGRNVQFIIEESQGAGAHNIHVNTSSLAAGAYLLKLSVNREAAYRKLIINGR